MCLLMKYGSQSTVMSHLY